MSRECPRDDDLPWTEERWEQQFRASEARAAKFEELFETLRDHPDRDAIIDREMGWDRDEPPDEEVAELLDALEHLDAEELEEAEAVAEERQAALRRTPAYARAYRFGLRVHEALKPYLEADKEEQDEDMTAALANGLNIGAKLAGAHALGEDDAMICGNIARCKRALAAAEECVRALRALGERGAVEADTLGPLVSEGEAVCALVAGHIADLRRRVWWDGPGRDA